MATLAYFTFDLLVEKSGGYRVHVVSSPVGESSATFAPPFTPAELDSFLARVGRRGPISGSAVKPDELLKQFGGRLFDSVLNGEILTAYRRSRDAAARENKGLRLKLRLNDVPELADLPWEYLYDASRESFLALSKETPVVRFLELPEPVAPLVVEPPLNLLAVLASPSDYDELDVEGEWRRMVDALEPLTKQNRVTLTRVEPPTLDALRAYVRRGAFHVLHFIGHGEYSRANAQGALVLTDETGKGRPVGDDRLATLLRDAPALRVVLLNACEGARTAAGNPFAGVAPRLVQQRIPAVLAMQFPISDPAALDFSSEFYRTFADGYPVDAAVNEARRAMYLNGSALEWGTPVLFMRAPDGVIFATEEHMAESNQTGRGGAPHGGISFGGSAQVTVKGDMVAGDKNVQGDEYHVEGDVNTVTIGAGAQVGQAAAGRGISQAQGGAPNDAADLAQKLTDASRALQAARSNLDPSKIALAEFQLSLLQNELTRTDGTPSGATIVQAADGLLAAAPVLRDSLAALFSSPAGRRVLERAGAADWAAKRFG